MPKAYLENVRSPQHAEKESWEFSIARKEVKNDILRWRGSDNRLGIKEINPDMQVD